MESQIFKYLISRFLRSSGRSHLLAFAKGILHLGRPAPVMFPPELLEQGVLVAVSGLANTLAIQSNPDWVWPAWVERQTDPDDPAFVPTGLNLIMTNLTLRNWTSIGVHGSSREAMVDPVGMLTPRAWGWSILPTLEGTQPLPKIRQGIVQGLVPGIGTGVRTSAPTTLGLAWECEAIAAEVEGHESIVFTTKLVNRTSADIECRPGFSFRPYNPLGFSPIGSIAVEPGRIRIDGELAAVFPVAADQVLVSDREHGDPMGRTGAGLAVSSLRSRSGMACASATWNANVPAGGQWSATVVVPLERASGLRRVGENALSHALERALAISRREVAKGTSLTVPDPVIQRGWNGVRARLHAFDDGDRFTPGTFLYHEHWFRDGAFLALGFENAGRGDRVAPKHGLLAERQTRDGFFQSQTGEWDSNGQAIWTLALHLRRGGDVRLLEEHWDRVRRGAGWIVRQRLSTKKGKSWHEGLLPAGFSAEHFGPNDHFFWDNFWSIAGLESAAWMASVLGRGSIRDSLLEEANQYRVDLESAISRASQGQGGALPCSPYRRMDAAAVGNLVAVCPLGVVPADSSWIRPTLAHIDRACMRDGLFFQSIVHTGYNPYLSVQVGRARLAVGDDKGCMEVLQALAKSASSTWCWPEAIHPRTRGGCMGDGDHGWAAAEFLSLVRQILVREVPGGLELCSGVPRDWLAPGGIRLGGATTDHGRLDLEVGLHQDEVVVSWHLLRCPLQEPGTLTLSLPDADGKRVRHVLPASSGRIRLEADTLSLRGR